MCMAAVRSQSTIASPTYAPHVGEETRDWPLTNKSRDVCMLPCGTCFVLLRRTYRYSATLCEPGEPKRHVSLASQGTVISLAAQTELGDDATVTLNVVLANVIEHRTTTANQHQQSTT